MITGTGAAVPDRVLTNRELEKTLDTTGHWIVQRTGIQERRIAGGRTATFHLAAAAAGRALRDARVAPEEVDLILVATSTPDQFTVPTAGLVQEALGADRAAAFDLSAACAGFPYGLATGAQFIRAGVYRTVLVVGAEIFSRIVNWRDRSTAILFGDGAGAVVLRPASSGALWYSHLGADGRGADILKVPAGGSRLLASEETVRQGLQYIHMNGREVFKFGVRVMEEELRLAMEQCGLYPEQIDLFVPHQANLRMIETAVERLGLPRDRVYVNIQRYGNTSAASIPIALDEAARCGCLAPGSVVAMVGFGAGLTWGTCLATYRSAAG
ncbi:3-oxoacyl-ACP synthase [Clostridiales bacterium PH28_bin88]|nr:3-oxoacyl-ACP synthase [Clostridiales bacterium PH28_bin88]